MSDENGTNVPEQEKEQEQYSFIKEKIKEKPIDKKKLTVTAAIVAGFAVLFGVIAAAVFCYVQPKINAKLYPEVPDTVSFPEDEDPVEEENASQTEEGEDAEVTEEPTIIQEKVELEIDDYKILYKKLTQLASDCQKSLVTITASTEQTDWYDNLLEDQTHGSGALIADNGLEYLILAEHDLVGKAKEIRVTLTDGTAVEAQEKAYDANTGISVLSVKKSLVDESVREQLTPVALGNSSLLRGGSPVFALGSPTSYQGETLIGHITSTGNVVHTIDANYKILTTDILGSESGSGFLANLDGELVGIISHKLSSGSSSQAVTAIPISEVKNLIEKLSNGGSVAYMGIKGADVTAQSEESSGMPLGIYVDVVMDSPAMAAGIQSGDIIISMNNIPITSMKEIQTFLLGFDPDQAVNIGVMRQGKDEYAELKYVVTLGRLQ